MDPLKHEYAHENSYILTQSKIGDSIWLERIRKFIPNFLSDDSENKIVYFEKGIYSLEVFMNIACVFPLYTHSCNVLSEQLSSILRYLALTVKSLGKSKELSREIGFKCFVYLGGEPSISSFTRTRVTRMTILDTILPDEYSEFKRLLEFDYLGELIHPNCSVDYSKISFSTLWTGPQPLPSTPLKNRCQICALESDQKICATCQFKSSSSLPQTPSINTSAFTLPQVPSTPSLFSSTPSPFSQNQNKTTFSFGNNSSSSILQPSTFGQNNNFFQNTSQPKNPFGTKPFGF